MIVKIGTGKTKKVNGQDLSAACFAVVTDIEDPKTWRVALHFPGNTEKSRASILQALGKFDQMRATWIPCESVQRVFDTIRGAAISQGIYVQSQTFEQLPVVPTPPPLPTTNPEEEIPTQKELRERSRRLKQYEAMADKAATDFLDSLGLD